MSPDPSHRETYSERAFREWSELIERWQREGMPDEATQAREAWALVDRHKFEMDRDFVEITRDLVIQDDESDGKG